MGQAKRRSDRDGEEVSVGDGREQGSQDSLAFPPGASLSQELLGLGPLPLARVKHRVSGAQQRGAGPKESDALS